MIDLPAAADILSSPSFNDTEAASQQLLAEASSPVRRPTVAPTATSTAAQRGASLLNAARMLPKPPGLAPAPAGTAGKLPKPRQLKLPKLQKPGKLPRASLSSLVSEGSQRKARGKLMYDIDPSPQKKRSSLPAQIAALEDEEEDMVPETSQVQPDDDAPAEIPEGLDVSAPKEDMFGDDDIVDAPTSPVAPPQENASSAPKKWRGRPRKSGDSVASRPSDAGTAEAEEKIQEDVHEDVQERTERHIVAVKPKRKARPERDIDTNTNGEARLAKKAKKLKGPKMISPDAPDFEEDVLAPTVTPRQEARQEVQKDARQESREVRRQERRQDARSRGHPQAEVRIPIRSTHSRTARTESEPSSATEQSATVVPTAALVRKGTAAQRIAHHTRSAITSSAPEPAKRKKTSKKARNSIRDSTSAVEVDGEDNKEAAQAPAEPHGNGQNNEDHGDAGADTGTGINGQEGDLEEDDNNQESGHKDGEEQDDERHNGQNEDADDADEQEDDDANAEGPAFPALDTVFKFADAGKRSGVCSMGLARKIHRRCDRAHVTLSGEGCSLDDITACKDDIVRLLASIDANVQEESRVDFKRDAFAYLFRALTLVLEAMYDKLQERERDAIESYRAMRILYPFVHETLRFKDTMDAWKVKVPQHTQGDRLIKGVETDLIAPLRIVEKQLKKQLGALRQVEQDRQTRNKIQRQREQQEQDWIRKEEALRSVRERRKRWQDLHIARMQYEPDPYRRRRLRFVEPPDAAETDANGNQFERVPFFGERSAPPPSSTAVTSGREWTQEQETVLLDALQSSACKFDTTSHRSPPC